MPFVSHDEAGGLLADDEPPPAMIVNRFGASPFLLVGDHAGNAIPRALGTLSASAADRVRHIAWDIGTHALGHRLSALLDAPFIHQPYSRLVIDCNRDPDAADAMPAVSDGTPIPGNARLSEADRAARIEAVHKPYHDAIAALIAEREAPIFVSLHSFTPRLTDGDPRPWQIGVLHQGHADGFAQALLAVLSEHPGLTIGDNEPYRMDGTDHTVPRHAFAADLSYAEIEVRQDLLADDAGIAFWADHIAAALAAARSGAGHSAANTVGSTQVSR